MSLGDILKGKEKEMAAKVARRNVPVWGGPEKDGITFSLLSRFLVCRERFRLLVVEGLKPKEGFNHRLEFGSMWHVCEEALAHPLPRSKIAIWNTKLQDYLKQLCDRFPLDREQVIHWGSMCQALFPVYVQHWSRHPDVINRTPLLQEQVFDVPYKLPSGRTVRLRGKWDSVDLVWDGKTAGIYIQENKTKSQIDGRKITQQLLFDLQTMMYAVALVGKFQNGMVPPGKPSRQENYHRFAGVRYNVVRRSAHKSPESMLKKVQEDMANGRVSEWFARWKVEISPADIAKFCRQCLDPILEQLVQWYDWVTTETCDAEVVAANQHYRLPYGCYNPLLEGSSSDLDRYLDNGSEVGLQRIDDLFPELK